MNSRTPNTKEQVMSSATRMWVPVDGDYKTLLERAVTGAVIDLGEHFHTHLVNSDLVIAFDEQTDGYCLVAGRKEGFHDLGHHENSGSRIGKFGLFIVRDKNPVADKNGTVEGEFFIIQNDGTEKSFGTHRYRYWDVGVTSLVLDEGKEYTRLTAPNEKSPLAEHADRGEFKMSGDNLVVSNGEGTFLVKPDGTRVSLGRIKPEDISCSSWGMVFKHGSNELIRLGEDGTWHSLGFHSFTMFTCAPFGVVLHRGKEDDSTELVLVKDDGNKVSLGTHEFDDSLCGANGVIMRIHKHTGRNFLKLLVVKG